MSLPFGFEFDAKFKELQEPPAHPEFYDPHFSHIESRWNQQISPTPSMGFRMYSLDNSYDFNDLQDCTLEFLKF